jgi:hypothetical protein
LRASIPTTTKAIQVVNALLTEGTMLHLPLSDQYKRLPALDLMMKMYPKNVAGKCSNLDEACHICGDVKARSLR